MAERLRAQVPADGAGQRFDQILPGMFRGYSRAHLAGEVKAGRIRLDGREVAPRTLVRGGEDVEWDRVEAPMVGDRPQAIDLDVVFEDADLLVIDKPAGLVVHPGAGNREGTLLNALLGHDPGLAQVPRAGILHRLDKDTSGLLVVARTLPAQTALVAMLAARDIHRRYAAIVNEKTENIGARRLHTILERLLDELSFDADTRRGESVTIDAAYVQRVLADTVKDEDLSRYVL